MDQGLVTMCEAWFGDVVRSQARIHIIYSHYFEWQPSASTCIKRFEINAVRAAAVRRAAILCDDVNCVAGDVNPR
jgi:hypothetical protein